MSKFKEWWLSRYSVIDVAFSVALSGIVLRLIVLDYGITFNVKLPSVLDKCNPLNWLTNKLFRVVLKWLGRPDDFSFSKTWYNLSQFKRLEVEMMPVREIASFGYHWKVHYDHWGHWLVFAVAGLELSSNFYDARHWDHEKNAPK